MKKILTIITILILNITVTFNTVSANVSYEGKNYIFLENPYNQYDLPRIFTRSIQTISLENNDSVVLYFQKTNEMNIIQFIKHVQITSYDDNNQIISTKKFSSSLFNTTIPSDSTKVNGYITGIQFSCNTTYDILITLKNPVSVNNKVYEYIQGTLKVKDLKRTTCQSSVKEESTQDLTNYDFPSEKLVGQNNVNEENTEEKLPTFSQIEELKVLIQQLKQELQNANNKLQQLENVLNELKPIAINIEQSVYSIAQKQDVTNYKLDTIAQKQDVTNNKLDDINNSIQSVENQLIPSNNKPIQPFNKNIEDLYSSNFIDNEVIKNNEIYYQEKELIDLNVPNIPVMDIEEWEGFSIEEEIEKDEVKNKDELMEMDNFIMDQTLPQQKFEMDKPLEMQQLEIQQFEMDTFEQTNMIERDKPMVWGEKP